MAMDRLEDFKLGMGVVIKADRDWRDLRQPSSCSAFARILVRQPDVVGLP